MCAKDDDDKPDNSDVQPDPELQVPLKKGADPKADAALTVRLKAGESPDNEGAALTENGNTKE